MKESPVAATHINALVNTPVPQKKTCHNTKVDRFSDPGRRQIESLSSNTHIEESVNSGSCRSLKAREHAAPHPSLPLSDLGGGKARKKEEFKRRESPRKKAPASTIFRSHPTSSRGNAQARTSDVRYLPQPEEANASSPSSVTASPSPARFHRVEKFAEKTSEKIDELMEATLTQKKKRRQGVAAPGRRKITQPFVCHSLFQSCTFQKRGGRGKRM